MSDTEQQIRDLDAINDAVKAAIHSGATVELLGVYNLPQIRPTEGERYFGIKCEECRAISPAFPDPSDGQLGSPFTGTGVLRLGCHFCSNAIQGGTDDIIPIRWP
jgi:hypothetical protein